MQHLAGRRLFLAVVLGTVVLFGSALSPNSEAVATTSGPVTAVFRPLVKVSGSVLTTDAEVMHRRLVSLGDGSSTATAADGIIDVRLVDVTDATTVLAVLATPAHLYLRPVLCDASSYVATHGPTTPTTHSVIPVCTSPYRFTSSDFRSGGGAFTYPDTDPMYSSYPTTLPANDSPSRVVILPSNGQVPSPRVVLGTAEVSYDGKSQLVTGTIIKSASAQLDSASNQWTVVFDLTGVGAELFNADAKLYYGTPLADDFDGTVISAPIIEARSFPGSGQVSGDFGKEIANGLAAELNSGALPVDVERVPTTR
jgi:hypothetical protein